MGRDGKGWKKTGRDKKGWEEMERDGSVTNHLHWTLKILVF